MNDQTAPTTVLDGYQAVIEGLRKWRSRIEQSLEYTAGTHTFDDVCTMVLTGQCQFYNFDDCFVIMELKIYPQCKIYHCFLAGGSVGGLLACQPHIISIAKLSGCSKVTLAGRKGWERAFKKAGWQHDCTSLYLPVENGED